MGAGFIVAILLARQYGPEGLGLITTSTAAVTIVMGFSALGLSGVLVRELVENEARRGAILLTVTLAKLVAGAVLLVVMVLSLAAFAENQDIVSLSLIMGCGYLFASFDTVDCLYNARQEFPRLVGLRVTALTISTLVKVGAIALDLGLEIVALGYALDFALMYVLPTLDFVFRKRMGIRQPGFKMLLDFAELKALLKKSWPVLVSGGFAQINLRVDTLLIAGLISVSGVGIYSAASRLSEAWSVLAMAIVTAIFPVLVSLARKDVPAYGAKLASLIRVLVYLSALGAIAIALLSQTVIGLLYGPEFAAAAPVLAIHIAGGVFLFLRTAVSRWLIIEDLLIFSLVSHASGAAINIALNLILTPTWGIQGAAWASVFSYATSGFLFLLFTKRTRTMFWLIAWAILPPRFGAKRVENLALQMAASRKEKP